MVAVRSCVKPWCVTQACLYIVVPHVGIHKVAYPFDTLRRLRPFGLRMMYTGTPRSGSTPLDMTLLWVMWYTAGDGRTLSPPWSLPGSLTSPSVPC